MIEKALEIAGLVTHYGEKEILKDISFFIPKGMTTVVLGGSGSGKSTLLKHMIGLLKPTKGEIRMHGVEITSKDEKGMIEMRKKMGVLFQGAALLNSITVADNVALPIKEHTKINASTIEIMVRMKLELVGLSGSEQLFPSQLSGGMKKRAGIARAMALDPDLLFLDEPSAGLDPVTAAGLDELIVKLKKAFKITIVVVTHELPSVHIIADYIVMLDKGEVLFTGTMDQLKSSENQQIKSFLKREAPGESATPEDLLKTITGEK